MPTAEEIFEWKLAHESIYSASVQGQEYIFRALTFGEYESLRVRFKDMSSVEQEDYIVRTGLLWPEADVDSMPPGVVTLISQSIVEVSGMVDIPAAKTLLAQKRYEAAAPQNIMYAFVLATMPYKLEDLDRLNFAQLARLVTLAEKIIEVKQASLDPTNQVTFDLIDPEEIARQESEEKERRKKLRDKAIRERGFDSVPPVRQSIREDDPIVERLRRALQ